jgi:hypothetical protein
MTDAAETRAPGLDPVQIVVATPELCKEAALNDEKATRRPVRWKDGPGKCFRRALEAKTFGAMIFRTITAKTNLGTSKTLDLGGSQHGALPGARYIE